MRASARVGRPARDGAAKEALVGDGLKNAGYAAAVLQQAAAEAISQASTSHTATHLTGKARLSETEGPPCQILLEGASERNCSLDFLRSFLPLPASLIHHAARSMIPRFDIDPSSIVAH